MPKQRMTKKMILDTAFQMLREHGEDFILVKNIANALSCSVQPIYSYYKNMEDLRQELSAMCFSALQEYVKKRIDQDSIFESTGKAYLSFAKQEPHLFKSWFLRKRENIHSLEDLYGLEASSFMAQHLSKTLSISESSAKKLHLNMIIYNMGLSFMMISSGNNFCLEDLEEKLLAAYHIFLTQAKKEGNEK